MGYVDEDDRYVTLEDVFNDNTSPSTAGDHATILIISSIMLLANDTVRTSSNAICEERSVG